MDSRICSGFVPWSFGQNASVWPPPQFPLVPATAFFPAIAPNDNIIPSDPIDNVDSKINRLDITLTPDPMSDAAYRFVIQKETPTGWETLDSSTFTPNLSTLVLSNDTDIFAEVEILVNASRLRVVMLITREGPPSATENIQILFSRKDSN